ncbi:MAG: tetratricopeptide repeat protein [Motiliproteus sp.]
MLTLLRKSGWRCHLLVAMLGGSVFGGSMLNGSMPGSSMQARADEAPGPTRLQQLLSGEALYRSQLNDYLSAIPQLQLAHEEGLLTDSSAESEVLLTRLKLGYGLRGEADSEFRALLDERIDPQLRNRAWYELARSFYQQRNPSSAKAVLDNIQGSVPDDIRGDHQLLQSHVLIALGQHQQAAQALESWRGAKSLRGYGYYNRGIALMLAGRDTDALVSLKRVVDLPAESEELLALRDKASVTIGYTLARQGDLPQARKYLQRVRLRGPSSNKALLASGWIAQQQGQTKQALAPWMELRKRALSDPAVQQSLLAVPSLYQQSAPASAVKDYEAAVTAFSRELDSIDQATASLQQGHNLGELLAAEPVKTTVTAVSGTSDSGLPKPGLSALGASASRLSEPGLSEPGLSEPTSSQRMGSLLASRIFQQTARGRSDLRAMIDNLDEGLRSVDALARLTRPGSDRIADEVVTEEYRTRSTPGTAAIPGASVGRSQAVPVNPLVGSGLSIRNRFLGLPTGYPGDFPDSEVIALPESSQELPDSYAFNLPGGGSIIIPNRGDWHRNPTGKWRAHNNSVPELSALAVAPANPQPLSQPQPLSPSLAELVTALSETRIRIRRIVSRAKLGSRPGGQLDEHIASLRQRIVLLRDRTVVAVEHYEQHARNLALEELQRSHDQLQHNLRQARLELAKSYDSANAH